VQALWTAARENLPITSVVFANRTYAILKMELAAAASSPGPRALAALDLAPPAIDFVALSKSLGVPATRVTTAEEFTNALRRGLESKAPNVIEVPLWAGAVGIRRVRIPPCPPIHENMFENSMS
jgi:acetolactate synthase I/II/III large subunit